MSKKILLCEARKAELDTNSLRKTIRRMPSHRLTVLLPPKLKKFVDDLVSKRRYGTENDIICSALRQWQVRNREIHKDFSAIRRNLKHRTPQVREAARKQFQARILEMAARASPKRRPQYDENEFIRKLLRPRAADHRDELVDQMIQAAKMIGAKTPREASEITMGRPLTDEEWGGVGESWNRRWY